MKLVPGGDNIVKGVQCYELFGGIALKIHTFSFFFSRADLMNCGKRPDAREELNRSVKEGRIE